MILPFQSPELRIRHEVKVKNIPKRLSALFQKWHGKEPQSVQPLPAHGSDRIYFRLRRGGTSAIGAYNPDKKENRAFLTFSRQFREMGLPVPEIYAEDEKQAIYLEQDLGDITLFDFLSEVREREGFSDRIVEIYKKVVRWLPHFQIRTVDHLDFSVCYPRASFDRQSMMWDLNYFKYYFLKLAKIPFDEQSLEDDFQRFCDFLLEAEHDFFLYRDFQSRNVMLLGEEPYFIDYQGGRRGALQYDIASLLYDAKADIPQPVRELLLNEYMDAVQELHPIDRDRFLQYYYGYVLIRIMQALGAYGFRGFYERKTHFLRSVPYAIRNLEWLLRSVELPVELPALTEAWNRLVRSSMLRQIGNADLRMTVRIQSFSYKRGIPWDERGHGGGFVFDCRALPNPGRYPEYAALTGRDPEVVAFLEKEEEVHQFMHHVQAIIAQVISNYQRRNFTDLLVAFGCTGGQHRSVYCADRLAAFVQEKFDVDVELRHRELEMHEQFQNRVQPQNA